MALFFSVDYFRFWLGSEFSNCSRGVLHILFDCLPQEYYHLQIEGIREKEAPNAKMRKNLLEHAFWDIGNLVALTEK